MIGTRENGAAFKVLMLMARTGGGHVSLAEALRDRLIDRATVEIVDPSPEIIRWHYRVVSRRARWLWSLEYRLSDAPASAWLTHQLYATLFGRNLARLIHAQQPDIVMSTYPFLTLEVMTAIKRTRRQIPFIMLFADPETVHHAWLTERRAALTLAPTRETYHLAQQAGFVPERLHLSGWPVRAQFWQVAPEVCRATLHRLHLDPERFTVFVQGGGEGAAGFAHTVDTLLKVNQQFVGNPLQIILAAGTNAQLLERYRNTPDVRAIPFTPDVAPYMAAANVIMARLAPTRF
ncbi:MAG: hypothetical protein HC893_08845 [Chloroflexaceae bacterium]|nr:hypothetical protein [Chloroflexaceae bacterium]